MYNHQYPKDDLSRGVCAKHKIGLAKTVAEALGGADSLDVDAVLLIIEHGDYPVNKFGQILYPRYELFEEVVEVFRRSKRTVPVFVDKHLSYDHTHAARMVATANKMGFGLMAGSSLPVTWRRPEIEPPLGTRFREAVVTYGQERPPYDIYLFHALESLQCMLERRAGGETGVRSVTFLSGDDVWKAGDAGKWSWALAEAALSRSASLNYGTVREQVSHPRAILVDYKDGTRGAVLNLAEKTSELCFAGKIEGRGTPMSTRLVLPAPPGARFFDPLVNNIEKFFATGKSPYPVERTLLTSTILDLAMSQSAPAKGKPISSPMLNIQYQPVQDSGFFRGSYIDAGGD